MNFDFFNTIRRSDRTEALNTLIAGSYPRRELFLVTALAAGIAGIGLITDNLILIIGSMIVAPLLLPLLALGLALAIDDGRLLFAAFKTISIATIVSVLFVIPIAIILDDASYQAYDSFYLGIKPTVASSIVAILAGVISAFAVSKKNLNSSMSGVAISVALMPPLAGIGIAIAHNNIGQIINTTGQYTANVILIAAFSALVFNYLHFSESLRQVSKALKNEERVAEKEKAETQQ